MVSYQAWVSIVFETVKSNAQIDDIDEGATVMRFAGRAWNRHGDRLERYSEQQAQDLALRLLRSR